MLKKTFFYIFFFLYITPTIYSISLQPIDTIPYSAYLLSEYIQKKSVTGNEKEAGLFFSHIAQEHGLYVTLFNDKEDTFNFAASLYPLTSKKPNVVLLTHIDVVEAQENEFNRYPPFSGTIAEGYIWGRGSLDNKGMGVMQLIALSAFISMAQEKDLPYNITILAVSSEEIGGDKGAAIVAEQYLEYLNPIVVFGEGGVGADKILKKDPRKKIFGIGVAAKRMLWLELTLNNNKSGHGSVPISNYSIAQQINALERIIRFNQIRPLQFCNASRLMFKELGNLEKGIRKPIYKNIHQHSLLVRPFIRKNDVIYSVVSNTITITNLYSTPGPANIIATQTKAVLDCRLLPGTKSEQFIKQIKRSIFNDSIHINILKEGVSAPTTLPDQHYFAMKKALESVYDSIAVIPIIVPASNDNNYFRAKGIPTYGILPLFLTYEEIASIHNVNERISIEGLEKGIKVYKNLIAQYLNNEVPYIKSFINSQ